MINTKKTYRKTERVVFWALPKGRTGETRTAFLQFNKDYTESEGAKTIIYKDGKNVVYDMASVNMFSGYYGKQYRRILLEYNRRMIEETGYIYE